MPEHGHPSDQVVVVGAGGFIGRAIVQALRRQGLAPHSRTRHSPAVANGALDPKLGHVPTWIIAAGRSNPLLAERDPSSASLELREASELARVLRADGRVRRVLVASSGGATYDSNSQAPFSEDAPVSRSTAYARLKLDIESAYLDQATVASPCTIMRLANVYGPGQRLGTGQGVVGHWIEAMLENRPIQLFGDPETTRDYLYVTDAAEAFVCAHRASGSLPDLINIGSGEATSLRQLLLTLMLATGRSSHPVSVVVDRPFDRRQNWLKVTRAANHLGWQPEVALLDGLRRTWSEAGGST